MRIRIWRVCPAETGECAYDGNGALKEPGRWHEAGTRIVYASSSLALASLEFFVGLDGCPSGELVAVPAELPAGLIEELDPSVLPEGWKRTPSPAQARRIGTEWIASSRSAALAVPSELVAHELNYLLNPMHPEFRHIRIFPPEPFVYDERMWKPHS
jgi:RES domain-containing protein